MKSLNESVSSKSGDFILSVAPPKNVLGWVIPSLLSSRLLLDLKLGFQKSPTPPPLVSDSFTLYKQGPVL